MGFFSPFKHSQCSDMARNTKAMVNKWDKYKCKAVVRQHRIFRTAVFVTISKLQLGVAAAAAAKLLQSCPTLCNPIDGSPPGSPVPGILQARTQEWVAISFSNAWKWKVEVKSLSSVRLLVTSWTAPCQAPPSMGFSRQEYWSGVPLQLGVRSPLLI